MANFKRLFQTSSNLFIHYVMRSPIEELRDNSTLSPELIGEVLVKTAEDKDDLSIRARLKLRSVIRERGFKEMQQESFTTQMA